MNKKIIKKLTAVFLSLILLCSTLLFSACKELVSIDGDCYVNRSMKLDFSQDDYDKLTENIASMLSAAENENYSEVKYIIVAIKTSKLLNELADAVSLSQVYYFSDVTVQETYEVYSALSAKFNTVYNSYKGLLEPTYHSMYRELFFGDMTDEEIEELIAKSVVSDELVELNNQITDIQARFNAFTQEEIMGETHDELFAELIETENEIAAYNGCDGNYMDYCYSDVYGRDYTPSDAQGFAGSLKENLLSAAENARSRSDSAAKNLSQTDMQTYANIFEYGSFESKENRAILDGFYKSMGEDIYSVYKQFMKKGYYYIARSDNAYEGAFTNYYYTANEPYIYFSQGYATPITFVHEFGHYCNMYLGIEDSLSYDLAETHSQGAEWMFISYLKDVLNPNVYSYTVNSYFYKATATVVLSSVVGAFEIKAFEADRTAEGFSFDGIINAITEEVVGIEKYAELYPNFMTPSSYYRYVVVNSSGYYISYAVSLISALQYYALAQADFNAAAKVYCDMLGYSGDYLNTLNEIGLSSPFETNTFSDICAAFAEV